ncbi:MAG: restriction endonuclease subunit S [Clostridiales bacterium]|nr:restriction endonuclease subunit S [Clostridiales bacterium]
MALTKHKLGEFMIPFSKKCGIANLTPYQVSGVNRDKEFFEPSHQVGEDTSKYQVVPPLFFACNLMHVGRDMVLPIAYNHSGKDKYVSPAYTIFSLKKDCGILDEYFFIMLKCEERDRYFWFHADGSVRDGMTWHDFCELEIELPDLPTQQKYVDIYKAMVANQQSYERGLEDLKLVCDGYIEDLRRNHPCKKIGQYIQQRNERNSDKTLDFVMGLSTKKEFREAQSRVNRDELGKYKIVNPYDIAFVPTTDTWKVLAFAVNRFDKPLVVSPIYEVFSVNQEKLLSQYLAIWLSRTEFDRYARYNSWGSARENFSFEDMQNVEIPIPEISIQQSIVDIYNAYIMRREINEQLKSQIKNICPILIKGSLEEGK